MDITIGITPSSFAAVDPAPRELLEKEGFVVRPNPYGRRLTKEESIGNLEGLDGLIAGLEPLDAEVLRTTDKLKVISRVGIGIANIDMPEASSRGVAVFNTPEAPTVAVAEATLMSAMMLLRNVIPNNAALHRREWTKQVGRSLAGLNVLFVGYGRIGRRTADLFRASGARILVFDPYAEAASMKHGEELVELEAGLSRADITTLHASGEAEIIGTREFECMKQGGILLNPSRGQLVNEEALCRALDDEVLLSCWFDAFWTEPYEGPLCDYPQALLTPHNCTYTEQCRRSMEMEAAENLIAHFKGA
tara:strand:- start:5836 stop:6753 length:918 start_codon:yes stop_codon:yes gene_type:complete